MDSSKIVEKDGSRRGDGAWGLAESVGEYIGDGIVDTGEVMGCGFGSEADGEDGVGLVGRVIVRASALEPDGRLENPGGGIDWEGVETLCGMGAGG